MLSDQNVEIIPTELHKLLIPSEKFFIPLKVKKRPLENMVQCI